MRDVPQAAFRGGLGATATARIGGVVRDVAAWQARRALGAVGQAGSRSATGTLVLADDGGVVDRQPSPWRGGLPGRGSAVSVEAAVSADDALLRVFTGEVDSRAGGAGRPVEIGVIDRMDRLNRPIRMDGLMRMMPVAASGGSPRRIGLSAEWLVDEVFRQAGFYCTPPRQAGCVLDAPMQGTVWARRGTVTAAQRVSDAHDPDPTALTPTFWQSARGYLVAGAVDASWSLAGQDGATPLVVSCVTPEWHGVQYGASTFIHLTWQSMGLRVRISPTLVRLETSAGAVIASLPATPDTYRTVAVHIADGTATVRTDQHTAAPVALDMTGAGTLQSVRLYAGTRAGVGGLQVAYPGATDPWAVLGWTPSARIETQYLFLDAIGVVDVDSGLSLLSQVAAATCSYLWVDEDGVMRWAPAASVRAAPSTRTLTARDHLLDLSWSAGQDRAQNVAVTGSMIAQQWASEPTITVWEGPGDRLDSSEVAEQFIGGPGELWLGVDTVFSSAVTVDGTMPDDARRGRGSLHGGTLITGDTHTPADGTANARATIARVGERWKVTVAAGTVPAGTDLALEVPDLPSVPSGWRGRSLPMVRARARSTWTDTAWVAPERVPGGPVLVHEGGRWLCDSINTGSALEKVGAFLADYHGTDRVQVTVQVIPDLAVQLADVVTVRDPGHLGVAIVGVVAAVTLAGVPGRITQSLTLDVISASWTDTTLAEHDRAWRDHTLSDLDTTWAGQTLADLDADPLGGAPHA